MNFSFQFVGTSDYVQYHVVFALIFAVLFLIGPDDSCTSKWLPSSGTIFLFFLGVNHNRSADDVGETMHFDYLVNLIYIALSIFTREIANLADFAVTARLFPAENGYQLGTQNGCHKFCSFL